MLSSSAAIRPTRVEIDLGALRANAAVVRDVAGVACLTGPGRFTAVRIGVTFADTLARSLGVPAVGLTRFEAFGPKVTDRRALVVAALREEWYLQFWGPDGPAAPPVWVAKDGLEAALGGAAATDVSATTMAIASAGCTRKATGPSDSRLDASSAASGRSRGNGASATSIAATA